MADGFRILEDGSSRILESSDFRITEQFAVGEVSLTASGTQASVGNLTTTGASSLAAVGSKVTAGVETFPGVVSLTATSSFTSIGDVKILAASALESTGTMTSESIRTAIFNASLSSVGSKIAAAERTCFGVVSGEDFENTRILENGDVRVTEAGDTRIILDPSNTIVASIVVDPNLTVFTTDPYYNDGGTWKSFVPYVKYNGAWTGNIKIYKNQNGTWKRSY